MPNARAKGIVVTDFARRMNVILHHLQAVVGEAVLQAIHPSPRQAGEAVVVEAEEPAAATATTTLKFQDRGLAANVIIQTEPNALGGPCRVSLETVKSVFWKGPAKKRSTESCVRQVASVWEVMSMMGIVATMSGIVMKARFT